MSREAANFLTDRVASAGSLNLPTKSCNEHGKKKCQGSGALFRALRKPDPPFTNSYGSFICWRKQPDLLQKLNLPAILVKLLLGVNIRANIFRMEKQNITISDELRAQFYPPRSEFIYDIIEISHAR